MTVAFIFIGIAVLALIALVAAGYGEGLTPPVSTVPASKLPPVNQLHAPDVDAVAFPVVVRGYRMQDVDAVMEHLTEALRQKDQQLAVLVSESKRQNQLLSKQPRSDAMAGAQPSSVEPAEVAQVESDDPAVESEVATANAAPPVSEPIELAEPAPEAGGVSAESEPVSAAPAPEPPVDKSVSTGSTARKVPPSAGQST